MAALFATALFFGFAQPSIADDGMENGTTIAFAGVDGRENNAGGYAGIIHYFTGDNFSDGFFVRLDGYYADYDYNTTAVAGGRVNADAFAFDALIGYQKAYSGVILRGLVGGEYANHDLSPVNVFDKNNSVDFGVKLRAEIETDYSTAYYGNLIGSYGTAKEHYWTRGRAGYDFDGNVIGPEASLEGNGQYNDRRIGAFLSSYDFDPVYFSGSVGYSSMANRNGGSAYGTLEISTRF